MTTKIHFSRTMHPDKLEAEALSSVARFILGQPIMQYRPDGGFDYRHPDSLRLLAYYVPASRILVIL